MQPLPTTRKARARMIRFRSAEFCRRMGRTEIDKLLFSLSKTKGLNQDEIDEILREKYNVDPKWVKRT